MTNETNGVSRRSVLKGAAVGGVGLAAGGALLAGCGSNKKAVTFTVRGTDPAGVKIAQAVNDAYTKKTGIKVTQQAVECYF